MSLKKFSRKIIVSSLLALFVAGFGLSQVGFAKYSWGDFANDFSKGAGKAIGSMFGGGDSISFTDYEGALAELSDEGYDPSLTQYSDFRDYILNIVNFALGFLGLFAVIMVIYGGVLYVSSGGEEETTGKGKKVITYAVVGLLIVMGSFAFVNTIIRGALVGDDAEQQGQLLLGGAGSSTGSGFNASAEQIRVMAQEIYDGFVLLGQSTEALRDIKNSASRTSLDVRNYPTKGEITAFLFEAKSVLQNINNSAANYPRLKTVVKNKIRKIDFMIDTISSYGRSYVKVKDNYEIKGCKPNLDSNTSKTFVEGFTEGISGQNRCEEDNFIMHDGGSGALNSWASIQKDFFLVDALQSRGAFEDIIDYSGDGIYEVLSVMADSYTASLIGEGESDQGYYTEGIFGEIYNIWSKVNNIAAAVEGGHFETMFTFYNQMLNEIQSYNEWDVDSDLTSVSEYALLGLEEHAKFYENLARLQFVQARLSANVTEGSAPLEVIFNVGNTTDPAGGTIKRENIAWDLSGAQTFDELFFSGTGFGEITSDTNGNVRCDNTGLEEEIGENETSTLLRCIYEAPGTYSAAVSVRSNDPNQYAPGISVLPIRVNPPTVKINLKARSSTGDEEVIIEYEGETPSVNRNTIAFPFERGMEIAFDAQGIENSSENTYKWNLGAGEIADTGSSATYETEFNDAGRYSAVLEVTSPLGTTDKKFFTILLTDVVARVKSSADDWETTINTPVTFDGSFSRASKGVEIKNYQWKITRGQAREGTQCSGEEFIVDTEGRNERTLTHSFDESGTYCVSLTVMTDQSSQNNTFSQTVEVDSLPPVSVVDYKVLNKNQPSTFQLNASGTYDPDEPEKEFTYFWDVSPGEAGRDWQFVGNRTDEKPQIIFNNPGDYEVTLEVYDAEFPNDPEAGESGVSTKSISVTEVLDVAWDEDQQVTASLTEDGQSEPLDFTIISRNGVAYEIDFGDGETDFGDIVGGTGTISHSYRQAGAYTVELTVFDANDNDKSITKRVFVSGGDDPISIITLYINENEVADVYSLVEPVEVTRDDVLKFDAGRAVNTDGTGRKLGYSWDFGDTNKSSKKLATHSYDELGTYNVKLSVYDEDNPTKTDQSEMRIKVVSIPPKFNSVQGIPVTGEDDLITPVTVNMQLFGADDPDGKITQYKWWYFDLDDPDEQLGVQITSSPNTQITIGTMGDEDLEVEYGFGLEITDSDGLKFCNLDYCAEEILEPEQYAAFREFYSTITVVNGPNELPTAKFNVDKVKAFVGEPITFTSASSDPDGQIVEYVWDFEGDGFFNNEPTEESSVSHIYNNKNMTGYSARLKVIDDKGGEVISDPVTIYIDSNTEDPVAAFKYEVVPGSAGKKVQFINNSRVDEENGAQVRGYSWDFDIESLLSSADSDGDGEKDNDVDSTEESPQRLYTQNGTYKVKLTVMDNQGNTDEVIQEIKVPLASPPTAAFTYEIANSTVVFINNSSADINGGAQIADYIWDFDTQSNLFGVDSDGDGIKDNDRDSTLAEPTYKYPASGTYYVKLTVVDDQGSSDSVINPVNVESAGQISAPSTDLPTTPADDTQSTPQTNIKAALLTDPTPARDGAVYLDGEEGSVTFNFSKSTGEIAYYIIDKNIHFDTNGDGIRDNDQDFKTSLPGKWTTHFMKEWGKTVAQLKVVDIYGNSNTSNVEIKFK